MTSSTVLWLDLEVLDIWQGPARHIVCLEKVNLASGECVARNPSIATRSAPGGVPHRDTHSYPLGGQAVYQSPTKETPTAKHDNRRHPLLRRARKFQRCEGGQPSTSMWPHERCEIRGAWSSACFMSCSKPT